MFCKNSDWSGGDLQRVSTILIFEYVRNES